MSNYSEVDILPEALKIIHTDEYAHKGINMTELQPLLRVIFRPNGDDIEILPSHAGSDSEYSDHFAQKCRNMVSNRSLEYTELVDWTGDKPRIFFPIGNVPQIIEVTKIKFRPKKRRKPKHDAFSAIRKVHGRGGYKTPSPADVNVMAKRIKVSRLVDDEAFILAAEAELEAYKE